MDTGRVDWRSAQHESSALDVFLLGCVDFDSWLMLQDRLALEIQSRCDRYGMLLLCEHPTVLSLGRDGSAAGLPGIDDNGWELPRPPVHWVGRGGGIWRHGPGQLSISLLVPLDRLALSPPDFLRRLRQGLAAAARELQVPASGVETVPGVAGRIGQFVFLGCAVRGGVSQFGAILNVAPHWEVLAHSPQGVRSSSLAAERTRPIAMHTVRECVVRHLALCFGYNDSHIHTGHPWLRRTPQTVSLHA